MCSVRTCEGRCYFLTGAVFEWRFRIAPTVGFMLKPVFVSALVYILGRIPWFATNRNRCVLMRVRVYLHTFVWQAACKLVQYSASCKTKTTWYWNQQRLGLVDLLPRVWLLMWRDSLARWRTRKWRADSRGPIKRLQGGSPWSWKLKRWDGCCLLTVDWLVWLMADFINSCGSWLTWLWYRRDIGENLPIQMTRF